jgi:hypothetical protein
VGKAGRRLGGRGKIPSTPIPNLTDEALLAPRTPPPPKGYAQLTVFTKEGKTFTFRTIGTLTTNEYCITFTYQAMSDGRWKTGRFYVENLAGYSTTEHGPQ